MIPKISTVCIRSDCRLRLTRSYIAWAEWTVSDRVVRVVDRRQAKTTFLVFSQLRLSDLLPSFLFPLLHLIISIMGM